MFREIIAVYCKEYIFNDFRLPRGVNEIFALVGCYANRLIATDVSGQPVDPIFKGQENCLTFEDGTDRLCRIVGNCQSTVHNIPEE
jgi:hypothetical protein